MTSGENNWRADLELARSARAGDRGAVERFVERMRCIPRVLAVRNARLGRPFGREELDDLAQEVFTRLWERIEDYQGNAALESWAYRFCAWTMLDHLRRRERLEEAPGELDELRSRNRSRDAGEELDDLRLHAALAKLPETEGVVVRLKQMEDLSFEEIGARLAIPSGTAKTRYYRALLRLRHELAAVFGLEVER